jgi:methylmalonyl-CoA/ethylmalonyl-CoA epimerase
MTTALSQIAQIALPARDIARAVQFYRDALGLRFLFEAPPKMAFFDCDGVRLLIGEGEGEGAGPSSSILYFRVTNIQAAQADLAARQVRFVREPHLVAKLPDHELWLAFFEDSEGNALALMEERRA